MHSHPYMQQCRPQVFVQVLISLNMACITNLMMLSGNGWLGTGSSARTLSCPVDARQDRAVQGLYLHVQDYRSFIVKINISYCT